MLLYRLNKNFHYQDLSKIIFELIVLFLSKLVGTTPEKHKNLLFRT